MTVKSWFLNKEFSTNERIAIQMVEPTVERETEKAMLLIWKTEYGTVKHWVPKSCIEFEIKVEVSPEAIEKLENRENQFVKGAQVKKIGGRKIFTIVSDFVSMGGVWLDNGKKVDINQLVLA